MRIRRAEPADAAVLSALSVDTFVDTFGHLYPPEDLACYLALAYAPESQAELIADPAYGVWLAERDGHAIAYAVAGPAGLPHPDVAQGDGELKRLYVRAGEQNGGLGSRLFAQAMAWLERDGPRTLWISVWSENFGAQRFYARHGFEFAGEYEFIVGAQRDREFMYRRLPASR